MDTSEVLKELQFKAVKSSGPGGQHVNKTASKIELSFNIPESKGLSALEKHRIQHTLAARLTTEGILQMQCSDSRSQHQNKTQVIKRFLLLMEEALKVKKRRKKTKPTKSSVEKRIKNKKANALKKNNRKPPAI